ncbi:ChaB family protein [Dactylosporangium sp. CS-047395]|uniref:ChaB family protein n=1 Tax=Dactylosporangium sp. CS-047395 TaxID=3239936 RepID=UPI003D90372A
MAPRKSRTDLPATLQRSDKHAQATWQETHDSAAEQYGDGERAHRTAFSALKHTYEKVGDHWERKDEAGPSDAQAAQRGPAARNRPRETAEGVDANASKQHLLDLARRLEIPGRSRMTKAELVEALMKANRRETARARR